MLAELRGKFGFVVQGERVPHEADMTDADAQLVDALVTTLATGDEEAQLEAAVKILELGYGPVERQPLRRTHQAKHVFRFRCRSVLYVRHAK